MDDGWSVPTDEEMSRLWALSRLYARRAGVTQETDVESAGGCLSRTGEVMVGVIRFRRLSRPIEIVGGIPVERWEIAFSEADLPAKLNGEMAEVHMPARPWWVRWWRRMFLTLHDQ